MRDSKRDTDVKIRLLDSVGEGEGGMIWENSIEACILSYVKQIASPGSMNETGCSWLVHWDDPEGWDGEGGGRQVQDGEYMYTHGWFRQWHPTPVLLPGKAHGQRSLVGCSPWGCEESDTTEWLHFHFHFTLQYCSGFLPYIDMNLPWVHMCSPFWIPLPPPSPSHPSMSFQCTIP